MRRQIRRFLPDHEAIRGNRWLAPFENTLLHPRLWDLNRHSAAGAVATGLFCGLIPGPLQMLGAAICAVAAPSSYWMIPLPGARLRPELRAFIAWVRGEAAATRSALGDAPSAAATSDASGA